MKSFKKIAIILFLTTASSALAFECTSYMPVNPLELKKIGADADGSGCSEKKCPSFQCKIIDSLGYANVSKGNFRAAKIFSLGYSADLCVIKDSNLSYIVIKIVNSTNLQGSNLQNAHIEMISGASNLANTDLRGAKIDSVDDLESVTWTGAVYDGRSSLPFSDEIAAQLGLIKQ